MIIVYIVYIYIIYIREVQFHKYPILYMKHLLKVFISSLNTCIYVSQCWYVWGSAGALRGQEGTIDLLKLELYSYEQPETGVRNWI